MSDFSSPAEISPPAGYRIGSKFYASSGELQLALSTPSGPLGAAMGLVRHAIQTDQMRRLGDCIDIAERGFGSGVVLRRETSRFLSRKAGISPQLVDAMIAQELYHDRGFE